MLNVNCKLPELRIPSVMGLRAYLEEIILIPSIEVGPPWGIGKLSIKHTFIPLSFLTLDKMWQSAAKSCHFPCPLTDCTLNCDPDRQKTNQQTNKHLIKLLQLGYFVHSKSFQIFHSCDPITDFFLGKNNTVWDLRLLWFSSREKSRKEGCYETESIIVMSARNWNCNERKGKFPPRKILYMKLLEM